MELTRPGYAVIYVILLCALAQGGSEGKKGKDEDFSSCAGGGPAFSSSFHVHGKQVVSAFLCFFPCVFVGISELVFCLVHHL